MNNQFLTGALICFLFFSLSSCTNAENKDSTDTHSETTSENQGDSGELVGRWNITVNEDGENTPAWLEVRLSGFSTLVGSFVGNSGSARPVSEVHFDNGTFSFSIPPQWEKEKVNLEVKGEVDGGELKGTLITSAGKEFEWTGVKAPILKRESTPAWGETISLFNGKDLTGWEALGENQWKVVDGVLTSEQSGSNLISKETFTDFKLHVEFRYKKGSNSGVYLRGRYEVQIEDSPQDAHPSNILFGGLYGFLTPNKMVALGPDTWQEFDITLVGRMLTVVANGETIISNQEIPGITGGALDSNEGEAGPIYIQGDHGPIEFRKIEITPAK